MIRQAAPNDIKAIHVLALEALNQDVYEELVIDPAKVLKWTTECVSAACNFAWVAEVDGKVMAAVCALVVPNMFYERSLCSILMFYSKAPGEGVKLLRALLRWARGRPMIKIIEFTLERNADPRIGILLQRLGLNEALPIYIEVRGKKPFNSS